MIQHDFDEVLVPLHDGHRHSVGKTTLAVPEAHHQLTQLNLLQRACFAKPSLATGPFGAVILLASFPRLAPCHGKSNFHKAQLDVRATFTARDVPQLIVTQKHIFKQKIRHPR